MCSFVPPKYLCSDLITSDPARNNAGALDKNVTVRLVTALEISIPQTKNIVNLFKELNFNFSGLSQFVDGQFGFKAICSYQINTVIPIICLFIYSPALFKDCAR